jgi:hypothetical protein
VNIEDFLQKLGFITNICQAKGGRFNRSKYVVVKATPTKVNVEIKEILTLSEFP